MGLQKVDTKQMVQKKDEQFEEDFAEGTFTDLQAFARLRNLSHLDEDALVIHIEDKLGLEVIEDKYGKLGQNV